jgi:D-alanyl-lipoteichoic acid acyltransferase DltB (MBOAT superfamily)
MLFNSFEFLIFFPVVTLIYFLLPHKYRWVHLLAASCYFYMSFVPIYILILFATIIIDYFAAIIIEKTEGRKRHWYFVATVVSNILVLCVFKYYNFFIDNVTSVAHGIGYGNFSLPLLQILLPIGLSFHTFQALSYVIEIKRGNIKAERHFGIYSLYVMFYPQLVAGPIERPQNMLHQFHEVKTFDSDRVMIGLKIMLWGLFKKVVIADRLALYVNHIFENSDTASTGQLWLAMFVFFPFQIYCDFSGYSSIALGSAKVMGFDLMENFRRPFGSVTTSEFWNRWHISLSSWFRDYLYQPIVMHYRNYGKWAVVLGLMITFFLSGFWHGAGWNFVVYGIIQGAVIAGEFLLGIKTAKVAKSKWGSFRGIIITYFFYAFSLIFFRSVDLTQSIEVFNKLFWDFEFSSSAYVPLSISTYVLAFLSIISLLYFEKYHVEKVIYQQTRLRYEVALGSCMVIALIILGVFTSNSFIYFQF